jgi:voltage-gated potassium channel
VGSPWREICKTIDYAAWLIFVLDYGARLVLAQRRGHYFSRHVLDLAVIVLPILRPLRLLRLVMLLRVLNRRATDSLRGRGCGPVVVVWGAGGA